jgi:hypothetical protein
VNGPGLAARHRPDDQVGLGASGDGAGQGRIGRLVRQIRLAGEEPHEGPPRPAVVVADGAPQHRVAVFKRVQDRLPGDRSGDVQLDLSVDPGQGAQVGREHDPDHGNVWTSTDSTAGRSRTIGLQLSPASGDT